MSECTLHLPRLTLRPCHCYFPMSGLPRIDYAHRHCTSCLPLTRRGDELHTIIECPSSNQVWNQFLEGFKVQARLLDLPPFAKMPLHDQLPPPWEPSPLLAQDGLWHLDRASHPCVLPFRRVTPPHPIGGHTHAPDERGRSSQQTRRAGPVVHRFR